MGKEKNEKADEKMEEQGLISKTLSIGATSP